MGYNNNFIIKNSNIVITTNTAQQPAASPALHATNGFQQKQTNSNAGPQQAQRNQNQVSELLSRTQNLFQSQKGVLQPSRQTGFLNQPSQQSVENAQQTQQNFQHRQRQLSYSPAGIKNKKRDLSNGGNGQQTADQQNLLQLQQIMQPQRRSQSKNEQHDQERPLQIGNLIQSNNRSHNFQKQSSQTQQPQSTNFSQANQSSKETSALQSQHSNIQGLQIQKQGIKSGSGSGPRPLSANLSRSEKPAIQTQPPSTKTSNVPDLRQIIQSNIRQNKQAAQQLLKDRNTTQQQNAADSLQNRLPNTRSQAGQKQQNKVDVKNEANDYFNALISGPLMNQSSSREQTNRSANLSNPQLLNNVNINKRSQSQVQSDSVTKAVINRKNSGSRERRPKSNLEGAQTGLTSQLPNILDQHNNAGSNRNSRLLKQTQGQQQNNDYLQQVVQQQQIQAQPVVKVEKPQVQNPVAQFKPSAPLSHPQPQSALVNVQNSFYTANPKQMYTNCITKFAFATKTGQSPSNPHKTNQDSWITVPHFCGLKYCHFFAVADGHGQWGREVSNQLKVRLPQYIEADLRYIFTKYHDELQQKQTDVPLNTDECCIAFNNAFLNCNEELFNSQLDIRFSGSTCVSIMTLGQKLFCINVGDSRAIVCKIIDDKIKTQAISRDQKPCQADEAARILQCGGRVDSFRDQNKQPIGPLRVWLKNEDIPGLAMTRSFGDEVASRVGVTCEPEILELDLGKDEKFIVLASDGVWEFLSNDDVAAIVKPFFDTKNAEKAAEAVVRESYLRWKREEEGIVDDITCIIVFLDVKIEQQEPSENLIQAEKELLESAAAKELSDTV